VKQWTAAHGIDQDADAQGPSSSPYRPREYKDTQGDTKVESFEIPGMGHAIPVDPGPGPNQCGKPGHYFAPTGACADLATLGARDLPRGDFLALLARVRDDPVRLPTERRPVARLPRPVASARTVVTWEAPDAGHHDRQDP